MVTGVSSSWTINKTESVLPDWFIQAVQVTEEGNNFQMNSLQ